MHFSGYNKFRDADGYPAVAPPWGTLNAIDMNTGQYRWRIPLGYYPALAKRGRGDTGTENYGGPITTASGLLFIGATVFDRQFRAFDKETGALLWQTELPYSGVATPARVKVFVHLCWSGPALASPIARSSAAAALRRASTTARTMGMAKKAKA